MSRTSFSVSYTQGDSGPGEIRLILDGQEVTGIASGRLDAIGDSVTSPILEPPGSTLEVFIECVRTSRVTMRVDVSFDVSAYAGSSDAYKIQKILEDVPLDFDP